MAGGVPAPKYRRNGTFWTDRPAAELPWPETGFTSAYMYVKREMVVRLVERTLASGSFAEDLAIMEAADEVLRAPRLTP